MQNCISNFHGAPTGAADTDVTNKKAKPDQFSTNLTSQRQIERSKSLILCKESGPGGRRSEYRDTSWILLLKLVALTQLKADKLGLVYMGTVLFRLGKKPCRESI